MEMHRPSYEVLKVTDSIYFTFCDGMQAEQGRSDHIRTYPQLPWIMHSSTKHLYQ